MLTELFDEKNNENANEKIKITFMVTETKKRIVAWHTGYWVDLRTISDNNSETIHYFYAQVDLEKRFIFSVFSFSFVAFFRIIPATIKLKLAQS